MDDTRFGGRILICDRDPKWSRGVEQLLTMSGVRMVLTPVIRKNSRGHSLKAVLVVETTQNGPHRHPTCWRQLMP